MGLRVGYLVESLISRSWFCGIGHNARSLGVGLDDFCVALRFAALSLRIGRKAWVVGPTLEELGICLDLLCPWHRGVVRLA